MPIDDQRGTAEFKRRIVHVYVERGLRTAAGRVRDGG
jgi:CO/xanthine dehydrogenase FAD-binding subunit